jgi:hypothetical protein
LLPSSLMSFSFCTLLFYFHSFNLLLYFLLFPLLSRILSQIRSFYLLSFFFSSSFFSSRISFSNQYHY